MSENQLGPRNAEDVVIEAQKIAALLQLGTFIKAATLGSTAETGQGVVLQLGDRQQTRIVLNSKLLLPALEAEFNKLGQELTDAGVELEAMMKGEHERFKKIYMPI